MITKAALAALIALTVSACASPELAGSFEAAQDVKALTTQPIPERPDPGDPGAEPVYLSLQGEDLDVVVEAWFTSCPDPDRMLTYQVDFDQSVLSEKVNTAESAGTVTLNSPDPVEVSGLSFFTLVPVAEGITDLTVSYSCSTGEEFFKTWTVVVS